MKSKKTTKLVAEGVFDMFKNVGSNPNYQNELHNKFVEDFINSATTSLQSAIKSGLVDPNIQATVKNNIPPNKNVKPKTVVNPSPAPAKQGMLSRIANKFKTQPTAAPAAPTQNVDQQLATVVNGVRNSQSGANAIPAATVNAVMADLEKAKYNKDYMVSSGNSIIDLAKQGYNINNLKTR